MCMSPSSLGNCTIYSTWCIMICLVIPIFSCLFCFLYNPYIPFLNCFIYLYTCMYITLHTYYHTHMISHCTHTHMHLTLYTYTYTCSRTMHLACCTTRMHHTICDKALMCTPDYKSIIQSIATSYNIREHIFCLIPTSDDRKVYYMYIQCCLPNTK